MVFGDFIGDILWSEKRGILGLKFGDFNLENHSVKISRQLSNNPLIDNASEKLVEE